MTIDTHNQLLSPKFSPKYIILKAEALKIKKPRKKLTTK